MEPTLWQEIMEFLSKWYLWEILIMLGAILLTLIVKIPIKRAAIKMEEKYKIDKSKITWINGMFPYIFVFIAVFLLFWSKLNWTLELRDPQFWKDVGTRTGVLGSGAIGLYELIKKIKQAVIASKQASVLKKEEKAKAEAGITEVAIHGDSVVVDNAPVKKTTKKSIEVIEDNPNPQPVIKETRH